MSALLTTLAGLLGLLTRGALLAALLTALSGLLRLLLVRLLLAALLATLVRIVLALLALFVVILAHRNLLIEMKREQEQQAASGFVPWPVMMRRIGRSRHRTGGKQLKENGMNLSQRTGLDRPATGAAGVEFLDENGGGAGCD